MSRALDALSLPEIVVLTGLDGWPLQVVDEPASVLQQCLGIIAGVRRWEHVVDELLAAGDNEGALVARTRVLAGAASLPEELEERCQTSWRDLHDEARRRRAQFDALLERHRTGLMAAELAEIMADVASLVDVPVLAPSTVSGVARGFDSVRRLGQLADDAALMAQLIEDDELAQVQQRMRAALRAVENILRFSHEEPRAARPSEAVVLTALRAVPDLIEKRELRLLERLACPEALVDADLVAELASRTSPATTHATTTPRAHLVAHITAPIQLGPVSQKLFDAEEPAAAGITDWAGLRRVRMQLELTADDADLAVRWMRVARASSIEPWRRIALGHALYHHGRAYLDRSARIAGVVLRDAAAALAVASEHFEPELFTQVALALVASRLWPRMSVEKRYQATGANELLRNPGAMFAWIRERGASDLVAELWAELPDEVDRLFLEMMELQFFGGELRFEALRAALTAPRLRARPAATIRRVRELLAIALPADLDAALDAVEGELGSLPQLGPASKQLLMTQGELVAMGCGRLPAPQPLAGMLGQRIADVLRGMVSDAVGAEARLHITPSVGVFYPAECSRDVQFPITISNTGGAISPDVSVVLRYEGAVDEYTPCLERAEIAVPPLQPEEEQTASALVQLHPEAAQHYAAWSFKAVIMKGAEVLESKGFSVRVQERGSVKDNPFGAGQAIETDAEFVGRDKQVHVLLELLTGNRQDVTPLVRGLRRVGKTSLIKKLLRNPEIRRRYQTAYWSVEDLDRKSTTTAEFLRQFAERIRELLPARERDRLPFRREDFRKNPYLAFETFCDNVNRLELSKSVLIAIDEFDWLVHLVRKGEEYERERGVPLGPAEVLQPQTFGAIRKMLMKQGRIRIVVCGLPRITSVVSYDDRLFGLLRPVDVGPFTMAEADAVMDMAHPAFEFPRNVRALLHDASGLQPYLLQLLCHYLYAHARESGRDLVSPLDVEDVIAFDILSNETYFVNFEELIADEDRPILRALATAQRSVMKTRRFVDPAEVLRRLQMEGDQVSTVESVTRRLRELVDPEKRSLVQEAGNFQSRFRFTIGLLAERLTRVAP